MSGHDNRAFTGDNPSIPGGYKPKNGHTTNGVQIELQETGNQRLEVNSQIQINTIKWDLPESTLMQPDSTTADEPAKPERDLWGNQLEFLMSCIAMSVGLGNVWRFPFTALENGGGAFLIPYLIVLFVVGKPIYYLEMLIGQFSSRGCAKVYDLCPAMRGKNWSLSV